MAQFLIVGGACVTLYGMFLTIRGLIRLYREHEMKMFWWILGFFLVPPALVAMLMLLVKNYDIWSVLPILVLVGGWIFLGYLLESYLRKEKERKANGLKKNIPRPQPGQLRKDLLLLAVAIVLWVLGVAGVYTNGTLSTAAVCACFFILASSLSDLWKYRGF